MRQLIFKSLRSFSKFDPRKLGLDPSFGLTKFTTMKG